MHTFCDKEHLMWFQLYVVHTRACRHKHVFCLAARGVRVESAETLLKGDNSRLPQRHSHVPQNNARRQETHLR